MWQGTGSGRGVQWKIGGGVKNVKYAIGQIYEGQNVLDTRKHANGVYIYEIVQDGKQVLNGKLIVNR